jgi:beta-lactamase class A
VATPSPFPSPFVAAGPARTTGSLALMTRAGDARSVTAHVGRAFPLMLTGGARTVAGATWAAARWTTPGRSGTVWVPSAAVTRTDPKRTASASIDALDAVLYRYLRAYGTRVGVQVWDRTHGTIYTHNASREYLVASSVKVEVLCAFLARVEAEGREPTAAELANLTAMIEWSDNDAALSLYLFLGDAPALSAYMDRIGVAGFSASPAWRGLGWSTITPAAQIRVFDLLRRGKLLDAKHTKLAMRLLRNVVPEHRVGVGSTAPAGADVAMKIGWTTGPDDMWVMNSSGIVTYGGVTYVIAVYTDRDATLEEGFAIVEHVCEAISDALLGDR